MMRMRTKKKGRRNNVITAQSGYKFMPAHEQLKSIQHLQLDFDIDMNSWLILVFALLGIYRSQF
jgi:hypothetical protein